MSDYFELVKRRESCRNFDSNRPVEPEKLRRCAEAAWLAPSACNGQPWKYLIVTNPELAAKLRPLMQGNGHEQIPERMPGVRRGRAGTDVAQGFRLAAAEGSGFRANRRCVFRVPVLLRGDGAGAFHLHHRLAQRAEDSRTLWSFAGNERVRMVLAVGYAKTDALREKKRKPIDEVVKYYE